MKTTTMMMMIVSAAMTLTMMQLGVTACGSNGAGEGSCSVDNIPVMTSFDPKSVDGRWYMVMQSHAMSHMKGVKMLWWDLKYTEFTDKDNILEQFIFANKTVIFADGRCLSTTVLYDVSLSGEMHAAYRIYPDVSNLVQSSVYVLDASTTTLAFYHEALLNGQVNKPWSAVAILVRDHKAPADLASVKVGLEQFCGPTASSPSFFKKYTPYDDAATCSK